MLTDIIFRPDTEDGMVSVTAYNEATDEYVGTFADDLLAAMAQATKLAVALWDQPEPAPESPKKIVLYGNFDQTLIDLVGREDPVEIEYQGIMDNYPRSRRVKITGVERSVRGTVTMAHVFDVDINEPRNFVPDRMTYLKYSA